MTEKIKETYHAVKDKITGHGSHAEAQGHDTAKTAHKEGMQQEGAGAGQHMKETYGHAKDTAGAKIGKNMEAAKAHMKSGPGADEAQAKKEGYEQQEQASKSAAQSHAQDAKAHGTTGYEHAKAGAAHKKAGGEAQADATKAAAKDEYRQQRA